METINLNTRIIDLTVDDLVGIISNVIREIDMPNRTPELPQKRIAYGIAGIAQIFNCSMTTANRIKASGKIDRAISQCGRKITIDVDLALELMRKE